MKKEKLSKLTIIMMAMSLVSCTGLRKTASSESRFKPGELVPFKEAVEDEVVYFVVDSFENSTTGTDAEPAYRQETMTFDEFVSKGEKKEYGGYFWFKFKEDVTLVSYSFEIDGSLPSSKGYFDCVIIGDRDKNSDDGFVKGKKQWRYNSDNCTACSDIHHHEIDNNNHVSASCQPRESFDISAGKYYCFNTSPCLLRHPSDTRGTPLPSRLVMKDYQLPYFPYEVYNVNLNLIKR